MDGDEAAAGAVAAGDATTAAEQQQRHRDRVKQHYDAHVKTGQTTEQALRARRMGAAAPLKAFHNDIKRRLILRFARGAESLLDFACGRGGDLQKWQAAGIAFVKGVDLSPAEVAEAQRRYGELRARSAAGGGGGFKSSREPQHVPQCEFVQSDHLGDAEWRDGVVSKIGGGAGENDDDGGNGNATATNPASRTYDCITCMFALHYFFERESSLSRFLANVALNLKPGGYFVGTCPDGKRVQAALKKATATATGGGAARYEAPMLRLTRRWGDGKPAAFGSAYTMEILDTVVQGHRGGGAEDAAAAPAPETEGSDEFLVFPGVLEAAARAHGLEPVAGSYGDPALDALFEAKDLGSAFKHFQPTYPPGTDPSLADASRLNMAFAFRKVGSAAEAVPPPLVGDGGGGGGASSFGPGSQQQPMAMPVMPPQQQQMMMMPAGGGMMMQPPMPMPMAGGPAVPVMVAGPAGPQMVMMTPEQQQQMMLMQQQQQQMMMMMQQQQQQQMMMRPGAGAVAGAPPPLPSAWRAARERVPGRFYADPRGPPLLPPPTVGPPPGQRDYGAQQAQEASARAARLDVYAERLRARALKAAAAAAATGGGGGGGAGGAGAGGLPSGTLGGVDEASRAAARAAAAAALAKAAAEQGACRKRKAPDGGDERAAGRQEEEEEEPPEPEADADDEGPARPAKRPAPASGPAVDAAAMYGDLDDDDDLGGGGGGGAGGGGGGGGGGATGYAGDF